jgi:hypothetical protein
MFDWLGLVIEAEHPEPKTAPDAGPTARSVATIVRQYQPPTADLWRQDTPSPLVRHVHHEHDG